MAVKDEIWKDIPDYEGLYQVSNLGRVKSVKNGCVKSYHKNRRGYCMVELYKSNRREHKYIHRLVARVFIPKSEWKETINHKDENKENNRLDNLEFMSFIENIKYGTRGERSGKNRINHPLRSLQICQYDEEMKLVNEWVSIAEAHRQTGITRPNIIKCLKGYRQHAGGYRWAYKRKEAM